MKLGEIRIVYRELPLNYALEGDSHPTHEMICVDRGAVHIMVGRRDFVLRQGHLCLILPGRSHSIWARQDQALNYVDIFFNAPDFPSLSRLGRRSVALAAGERQPLRDLVRLQDDRGPYQAEMEEAILTRLLIGLLRRARTGPVAVEQSTSMRENLREILVEEAKKHICAHLREPLAVGSIARALCVSPSHLSHTFTSVEGRAVLKYVTDARMAEAKDLLRSSALTVTEIADKVGYSSIHQFSKTFKAKTGFTPTEYSRGLR